MHCLEKTLEALRRRSGVLNDVDALWMFLGLALDVLLDKFYAKWNKINSRAVVRYTSFN